MGRTACTEPQCLYKCSLYFYLRLHKPSFRILHQIIPRLFPSKSFPVPYSLSPYKWRTIRDTESIIIWIWIAKWSEVKWRVHRISEKEINKKWSEVKWSEVKWRGDMRGEKEIKKKRRKVKWSEVKWSEGKWSEVKWSEAKWSEVKGSEDKWKKNKQKVKWIEVKWWEFL
jgi:hypothetical protein